MNTSAGTRCLNGSLVHESQCAVPVCETDGFYCTSPCSVTYSYCVSGRRTPTQFVPTGTVCNAGALVYPTQCASLNTTAFASCPTYNASIQCSDPNPCSPNFYYCIQYATYAVQVAPTGLQCYNNTFVLASDPVCTPSGPVQTFPIVVASQDWSVLTQYGLASALSTALAQTGTRIQPVAIYFPSVSAEGRRLASQQWMSVYSSYANLSTALAAAVTELPAILAANNLAVTMWLQPPSASASPSGSVSADASASAVASLLVSGVVVYSMSIVTCVVLVITVIMI